MKIVDLIAKRSDLSTFLVHLIKGSSLAEAKETLSKILQDKCIKAFTAFGAAKDRVITPNASKSQYVVCFSETPLEYISLLTETLDERRGCQFQPYGIAIPKKMGRKRDINPVWYIDQTLGKIWLINYINSLMDEALQRGNYEDSDISHLTPFIETMFTHSTSRKEFWWEREWRHVGDFLLPPKVMIVCPELEMNNFQNYRLPMIDAQWGLEKIIAHLAGFKSEDVDVF